MRGAVLLVLAAPLLAAQPSAIELLERKTLDEIRRYDAAFDGVLGMAAIDLQTGRLLAHNGETLFPQASVIKVPILIAVFRAQKDGRFRLSDKVTIDPGTLVAGSEIVEPRIKRGDTSFTVRELVEAMMHQSDNTATNRIIGMLGMDYVNRTAASLGAKQTRLQRRMMDGAAALRDEENVSTPVDMAHLMEAIYRGVAVDKPASTEMLEIMKGLRAGIAEGLPLDTPQAAKNGQLPGSRSETGVVLLENRPFVLSVMSSFIDDRRTPVPDITRIVFRHFQRLADSNRYGNRLR